MKKKNKGNRVSYAIVFLLLSMAVTSIAVRAPEKDSKNQYVKENYDEEIEVRTNVLVEDDENPEPVVETPTPNTVSKPEISYRPPANGNIICEFSMNKQIYSKTMDDYRTHSGTDIAVNNGDSIYASESGIVEFAGNDDLMGETVKIKHDNNSVSVYSGLKSTDNIVEGQEIKKGEVIGIAGGNIPLEAKEVCHIHFELIIDNQYVDPKEHIEY